MQRRDFLRLTALTPLLAWGSQASAAAVPTTPAVEPKPDGRPHRFALSRQHFLLDGQPFQIRSGEMHPIRIPAEHWEHRIRMAKAMGLNTIAIYLMWNALEPQPGVFDFHSGNRDFVRFIECCAQNGMWVYLRPGPYICGEWDFGGLPPYLLRTPDIRVRDRHDARYIQAVSRYLDAIAPRIAPLMASRGGPILMVQVENEYASFGSDLGYLEQLRAMWQERGIDGPFSISDGLGQIRKEKTYLPGAALGLDGDTDFNAAQLIAGEAPVWMGEGYPGWLTHWGDAAFQRGEFADTLRTLLAQGRSFNLYVVHGGTNFGFGAGANANGDYSQFEPVITSYDYGAPINEQGGATAEYHRFRDMIAAHLHATLPEPPPAPPVISLPALQAEPWASLWDNLPAPKRVERPQANELLFAQDHGMVLYRRAATGSGSLDVGDVRDYATVFHGGRYVGYLSRVQKPGLQPLGPLSLPESDEATLDILVDSFGHIGYGQAMVDRKGILGAIRLDGQTLGGWDAYSLPLETAWLEGLKPLSGAPTRAGLFFRAGFALEATGDCYLDMRAWDKGYVWVNGQLLGRYWRIGPQHRLYCPATWLRKGHNEIIVLDMHRTEGAPIGTATTLG
ncbi:beta-galactosidase [Dyella jiangningensis]|uniref:beta-galactosidase n=1 Tax=Dyella sp. AtDHG13 TaxID=1938897 RepID=UPI00088F61DB|nr:beta-galactosidase [Dyella sp. AtDHG13]PXV56101.1 beta-galactosidase [Dyella sp. AtDHG13]SDK71813.1 beta-galactosidase [Dyella jiangningensis]